MPTIGYNYQVIQPQYRADLQNVDLIAKVLMHKQREFDVAYQGVRDLQKQSLGINFINKKEQGRIDAFNEKVNKYFADGEFGDLSDMKTAQKYYSLFDEIGNDTTLISKYRQDATYQDQIRAVEYKRMSKDPAKAGFGAINYDNFMARVSEYSKMDLDSPDAQGYVLRPYTDYVDVNKELGERMKQVPIKKFSVPSVENGYLVTKQYEGRDPDAVKAVTEEYMATRGITQMREQAEYTARRAMADPRFQETIYNDHVTYNTNAQASIRKELDKLQEEIPKLTDPNQIKEYSQRQAKLESDLSSLTLDLKNPEDYFARDQDAIINDITQITIQDAILSSTQSYGGYSVSTKVEPDRTFLELEKMRQRATEFNIVEGRKNRELEQDAAIQSAKLAADGSTATTATGTSDGMTPRDPGLSYISVSDPTHISYVSTIKDAEGTLTKLYAQQANFLEQGLSHGDTKLSGEDTGLSLLIDPKMLDNNPYYAESPYLRAYKVALDELYTKNPTLADYIGKRPKDNTGWDRLKEANRILTSRVKQIMEKPANREEAQFANHLQDVNANVLSLQEFMIEANASGDPESYIANKQNVKIYSNAVYDFDLPENPTKAQKQKVNEMETLFRPSFENYLDVPAAEYNSGSTRLTSEEWNAQFVDSNRVRNLPFGQVRKVETGVDGTLKVFFKPEAFQSVVNGDTKDLTKSGVLSNDDAYFMVKMDNKYVRVSKSDIQAKGYLEMKDPKFNRLNWSNQMGFTVGAKPQKRWDFSADNQSVPFETRRSTLNNHVQVSIMGGPWVDYETSDLTAVITMVRQQISSATVDEMTSNNASRN